MHAGAGQSPLVDRRRELAELDRALAAARAGRGHLFLIAGEPGIGKTRVSEAIADRGAEAGMLAIWGRAWETGGAPSYWPWVQALRTLIGTRDDDALQAEVGQGARWLVQLLPELEDRLPSFKATKPPDTEQARFALFDAVGSFLHNAACHTPLVIVLDDLHAADPASLLMLEFVSHGIGGTPALLLGTYQEAAARRRPDVEKLIGALARESPTITLRGFTEEDLGEMVEQTLGERWPDHAVGALHRTTEGNPFFSAEIVRLLAAEGASLPAVAEPGRAGFPLPDTVRETVRRRFEPLDKATVEMLEAAAVIGREFRLATMEEVVADPVQLINQIDEAVAAGLVTEVRDSIGRMRFTHNLIRETLYSGLGTARRVALHRAVGEALERRYGTPPERLAELSHHFAEAARGGDARKAFDYSSRAGAEAMRIFAYEQAADFYELALDASEFVDHDPERRAELMLAWARARARSDHMAGREALLAAADCARELEDPRLFIEAALSMRAWPRGSGVLDDQPSGVLTEALERIGEGEPALRARVLARLAVSLYYWPGTEERRQALVEDAIETARSLDDPATLAHVLSNGQYATWGPDNTERDLAWMEELLVIVRDFGDDELELAARNRQIDFLVELNDLPAADAALRELELGMPESSDPRTGAYALLQQARHAVIAGRYADAERLNAAASTAGARVRDPNFDILVASQRAGLLWLHGRMADLEPVARRMVATDVTPAWAAGLVLANCAAGNEGEARRGLERMAANDFADIPRYNGWLMTMGVLAEACVHLGDLERAGRIYELLLPFSGRNVTTPQAIFGGPVAWFLGILATARGEWETAAGHIAAARETAARMGSPPVRLRADVDEAEMLIGRGDPEDRGRAVKLLETAALLADDLGEEGLQSRIKALTSELGAEGAHLAATPIQGAPSTASLRKEGDVWAFEVEGRSLRVRDGKGVRYIAALLSNPGVEIHAMELAGEGAEAADGGAVGVAAELGGPGADDAGPLLDPEAKAAYRSRVEDLRADIEEAEAFNDGERAARAKEEMEFLAAELAGAVGLGGRDRKAASNAERARVSVTKAIRATIKRIGEHDAALARELETTLRTGAFCVHAPDPRRPLEWRVSAR
jgi:hypothetical protein